MTLMVYVAGWTLMHFIWQGAVVGLTAAAMLRLQQAASAETRYIVACAALAAMLAAPIATARLLSIPDHAKTSIVLLPRAVSHDTSALARTLATAPSPSRYNASMNAARVDLDLVLPLLVAAWFVGVGVLLLRLAGGWWRVRRVHLSALALASSRWQAMSDGVASRLGVRSRVHVVDFARVETPTVLGCLRPVVLLPIAALANLVPAQVEAILAHELAHIRRHDYLVNLLQTVAETLLFYHPAVWWVSAQIRTEREHCCDDVAVGVCGDAVSYATALSELETWRTARTVLALAATDGSLLARVRRVLRHHANETQSPVATIAATLALLTVILTAGVPRLSAAIQSTNGQTPAPLSAPVAFEGASVKPNASGPTAPQHGGVFPGDRVTIVNPPLLGAVGIVADVGVAGTLAAQAPASPAFEVASVKVNRSDPGGPSFVQFQPGGRFVATNVPVFVLVSTAFGAPEQPLPDNLISGQPTWPDADRFDIEAKASGNPERGRMLEMLRTFLADRFKLAVHTESREVPMYSLALARKDGRLGQQLRLVQVDCLAQLARGTAPLAGASPASDRPRCSVNYRPGNMTAGGATIAQVASVLSILARRPVRDDTGLAGTFDVDLTWMPAQAQRPPDAPPIDPNGPSMADALQDQLGLKLEATKGPVDVLVIDHVEHPTEN